MGNNNQEFGKLRGMLFPIYQSEFRKFIPLTILFLCVSFNYSILRGLKDILVMGNTGADTIYFLKTYGVMPTIILMTIIYSWVAKSVNRDARFNIVIGYFFLFFFLCASFFIPNCKAIQLDGFADSLTASIPSFKGLWEAFRFWPISLLYINAEAWGTLALGVIFWTFANEITSSTQAKRFYSFLSSGAAIGTFISGVTMKTFRDDTVLLLWIAVGVVAFMIVVYNIFAIDIRNNASLYQVEQKPKKKKVKLSFMQSMAFLVKSKYLAMITMIVLGYNMFIALIESIWKGSIKQYSNYIASTGGDVKAALADIYGDQSISVSCLQLFFVFFVAGFVAKKSWKFAALFTPVMSLLGSTVFVSFLLFQEQLKPFADTLGINVYMFPVLIGLGIVVFIKAAKYTFFDTTKERSYIPLDEETKVTGKAAVDAIGSRLGKSLGSFIISTILVPIFGSMEAIRYPTFIFVFIILFMWIYAVHNLSILYEEKLKEEKQDENSQNINK